MMCLSPRRLFASLTVFLMTLSTFASADGEPVAKSRLGGVAIGGHDTVAYHSLTTEPQAAAVEGSKQFTVEYKGAKWRFATEESSKLFAANPDAYTPAYNGHCANALSLGEGLIRTDGTVWEIFDQQLYLFYAPRGRVRWLDGNWQQYKQEADTAWRQLTQ